ncbi:MAG: hypothetical protein MJ090_02635 [Clostridia bacterium]|nr:hypothetical protein [Clostridia bacterium]
MKKVLCLVLSLSLLILFASCQKETEKPDNKADISSSADMGIVNEAEYRLGDDASSIYKELKENAEKSESSQENYVDLIKNDDYSTIVTPSVHYVYNKNEKTVSRIVVLGKVYDYETGTDLASVKSSQEKFGNKGEEVDLTDKESRFFSGNENCTYLKFEFDNANVIFAFEDNALFGASLIAK